MQSTVLIFLCPPLFKHARNSSSFPTLSLSKDLNARQQRDSLRLRRWSWEEPRLTETWPQDCTSLTISDSTSASRETFIVYSTVWQQSNEVNAKTMTYSQTNHKGMWSSKGLLNFAIFLPRIAMITQHTSKPIKSFFNRLWYYVILYILSVDMHWLASQGSMAAAMNSVYSILPVREVSWRCNYAASYSFNLIVSGNWELIITCWYVARLGSWQGTSTGRRCKRDMQEGGNAAAWDTYRLTYTVYTLASVNKVEIQLTFFLYNPIHTVYSYIVESCYHIIASLQFQDGSMQSPAVMVGVHARQDLRKTWEVRFIELAFHPWQNRTVSARTWRRI